MATVGDRRYITAPAFLIRSINSLPLSTEKRLQKYVDDGTRSINNTLNPVLCHWIAAPFHTRSRLFFDSPSGRRSGSPSEAKW
jgi:hypothetical protein